jgi:nitrite reductase (NO-forming)
MKQTILAGATGIALVIGLAGCAGQPSARAGTNSIEITLTEMRFSPNRIDARVGQPITVTLVNHGSQRHDFAFPSYEMPALRGVETSTLPGTTTRLSLTFDRPGTFTFVCTIPGHAASGMTGAAFVTS